MANCVYNKIISILGTSNIMKVMNKFIFLCLSCIAIWGCKSKQENTVVSEEVNSDKNELYLLAGSYSLPQAEGIKLFRFNENTGEIVYVNGLKGISNPSYLTLSNDENYIYSVGEDDDKSSTANAIRLDKKTGKLTFINSQLTRGAAPCYIRISPDGHFLLTANYTGGSISIFSIEEDGRIGEIPSVIHFKGHGLDRERQEQAHLHCVEFTPDNKYLLANDLGTDRIYKYPLARKVEKIMPSSFLEVKKRQDVELKPGSGPRHICFRPDGKYAYLMNELSGAVTVLSYQKEKLIPIQYIQSDTVSGRGSADIHVSPDGKYVYSSNRLKADGIAIFKIDDESGKLAKVGYQSTGIHPRNFVISPNGRFLLVACRDSNCIQLFKRNIVTGLLSEMGQIAMKNPVCLKFISK